MNSVKFAPINRISLVCIPTREQDSAIAFYESLGFEKQTDTTFGAGCRWVEVYPPQGTTGIAIAPPPGNDPIAPVNTGITLTTNDIEASYARFKALGVDVDHEISRMGVPVPPMFWFRDPSGHTLLIVEQP